MNRNQIQSIFLSTFVLVAALIAASSLSAAAARRRTSLSNDGPGSSHNI